VESPFTAWEVTGLIACCSSGAGLAAAACGVTRAALAFPCEGGICVIMQCVTACGWYYVKSFTCGGCWAGRPCISHVWGG